MRKIFLLSFDDGTIWDKRFVELLNKYGIKATFKGQPVSPGSHRFEIRKDG